MTRWMQRRVLSFMAGGFERPARNGYGKSGEAGGAEVLGEHLNAADILRIWRLDASSAGGNEPQEELVLLKLRPEGSCRVATVPARRPDANEVVRAMSSQVAAMPCLGDDWSHAI
jgi:hypothetical protein